MNHDNLKELQRLLHEQRRAAEEKTYNPPADLAPSDLPNNEPGFEQYDDYNPRPAGDDDKFAMPYAQDPAAQGLREHVAGHDLDVMLEVAEQSGNEELIHQALDEYTDRVAREFLASNPDYLPTDDNLDKIVQELKFQAGIDVGQPLADDIDEELFRLARAGLWTCSHLTAAKNKLLKMGALEVPEGTARSLNPAELLHCQRMAVSDPVTAVSLYLCYASGKDPATMTAQQVDQHATQLLYDPRWRAVADDSALLAFSSCPQTGYRSTPERDQAIRDYAGARPLSFPLMAQAWAERKRQEINGEVQRKRNQPVSIQELDKLDDSAVERTYQQTMQERAQRLRAAERGEQPTDPVTALLQQKAEFEKR